MTCGIVIACARMMLAFEPELPEWQYPLEFRMRPEPEFYVAGGLLPVLSFQDPAPKKIAEHKPKNLPASPPRPKEPEPSKPTLKPSKKYATAGRFRFSFTKKPANWEKVDMSKPGYQAVKSAAKKLGVDYKFALGVAAQESRGNCKVTSKKGARGVMQVIDGTARKNGFKGGNSLYDCTYGAMAGVTELKYCLKVSGGNKPKALACYNAGPGWVTSVKYRGRRLPYETRDYIRQITGKSVQRIS